MIEISLALENKVKLGKNVLDEKEPIGENVMVSPGDVITKYANLLLNY